MARLLVLLAAALTACGQQAEPEARAAATITPVVVEVQERVQEAVTVKIRPEPAIHPAAVDLIVEFEVSSRAYYEARLTGVVWPGGASGPTWGIGYDGGHQTRPTIAEDWSAHKRVEQLQTTAGITGTTARDRLPEWRGIETGYELGYTVFRDASLPEYRGRARRAFGEGFEALAMEAQGALISVVYNRGTSMRGDARREMRVIRDECIPNTDGDCIAREIRSMCRLWRGTNLEAGLCRRREAEAELAASATAHSENRDLAREKSMGTAPHEPGAVRRARVDR